MRLSAITALFVTLAVIACSSASTETSPEPAPGTELSPETSPETAPETAPETSPETAPGTAPGDRPPASTSPGTAVATEYTGPARDPWLRPFSTRSIWNTPIGSEATYVPAGIPPTPLHLLEEVYLLRTDEADPAQPLFRIGSWTDRCSGQEFSGRSIHLPDGWAPRAVSDTETPNNPGVFLQPDGETVIEVNAMGRCAPDGPLFGEWGDLSQHVLDIYGPGLEGARGASKLSQFGGPIRQGELTGEVEIRHVLDLLIWSEHLWWGGSKEESYRWPATDSDSYAGPDRYRGTNPELRMGSLVAIHPSATPSSLDIRTEVGRLLFAAFQDYGAYITDDSAWDATYLPVEADAIGEFPWGEAEQADMARLISNLHVVTNNGPDRIGGGGTFRRPLLPEVLRPYPTIVAPT